MASDAKEDHRLLRDDPRICSAPPRVWTGRIGARNDANGEVRKGLRDSKAESLQEPQWKSLPYQSRTEMAIRGVPQPSPVHGRRAIQKDAGVLYNGLRFLATRGSR